MCFFIFMRNKEGHNLVRVCDSGKSDIAAARIPGVFSVKVSNVARGGATDYTWTRTVTVRLADVSVRIDLLQRLRVRVNRSVAVPLGNSSSSSSSSSAADNAEISRALNPFLQNRKVEETS